MTAYTESGMKTHLYKIGAKWSYDFGWELDDEFIGENVKEAYINLMKLKEKKK